MAEFRTTAVLLLVVGGFFASSRAQCLTANDNPASMNQQAAQALTEARFGFALESMSKAAEVEPQDNIIFSPHSLHEALSLVYFGARGNTEESLKKALHIPESLSKVDVQRFYSFEKSIEKELKANASGNYEYTVANRLWLTDARKIRECMLDFFGDELKRADFKKDPAAVRTEINDWVSKVTKGNIRDLIPSNGISEDTDVVLANAVYFKGFWQSRFSPENTKRDIFYLPQNKMVMTKFMTQKGSFNHLVSEELGAHIIELPYKGDEVSMYILLPPFVTTRAAKSGEPTTPIPTSDLDSVMQLLHRITQTEGAKELRDILDNGMSLHDVEVDIPKFTLERELPVKQLLEAMGAGSVLDPSGADLRGFVADGEKSPHLGDAVHRARIEVNEEGTKAAAATALFSFRSSRPSGPAIFKANHPFVYFIYEKATRSVLFSGVFRKPSTQMST